MQREIVRNLVVEATYVGNRGVWWPYTGGLNYNANTPQSLLADGLDITTAGGSGDPGTLRSAALPPARSRTSCRIRISRSPRR